MKQKLKIDVTQNNLVFGDCKDWLPYIDGQVDCIYIDPPWFSEKDYEIVWGNGYELRSFEDRFNGIFTYMGWMQKRLSLAKKKLKETGSIFVHCDYRANYKLREVLNEVFKEENFVNEIIWKQTNSTKSQSQELGNQVSTIFHYAKNKKKYKYKKIYKNMGENEIKKRFNLVDEKGRYETQPLKAYGVLKSPNRKVFEFKGKKEAWLYSLDNLKKLDKKGMITNSFRLKRYVKDHKSKKVLGNLWTDIALLDKDEKFDYPTQKPKALIKRIINMVTEEGDTVLDFFGGGGTTARACAEENRIFITGDVSPVAYRVMIDRLKEIDCRPIKVNPPLSRAEWLNMSKDSKKNTEFEEKICMFQGYEHNPSSKPVDGFANGKIPVEIKNHEGDIDVPTMKKFVGDMDELGVKEGIFIAWGFNTNCINYVNKIERTHKKKIQLQYLHQIIGELVLTTEQMQEYQALYEERIKESKQKARILHDPKPRKRAVSSQISNN